MNSGGQIKAGTKQSQCQTVQLGRLEGPVNHLLQALSEQGTIKTQGNNASIWLQRVSACADAKA